MQSVNNEPDQIEIRRSQNTLIVRLFVGLSAISEGRGRRNGNLYLFFAIIMVIISLVTLGTSVFSPDTPERIGAHN